MAKNILVIAPHSDDAELGLGGYIHRESTKGAQVCVAVLAQGSAAWTHGGRARSDNRLHECEMACSILGVRRVMFPQLAEDGCFLQTPHKRLVAGLEDLIFKSNWDELFIPLPSFHGDHQATYDAAMAALRPHLSRPFPASIFAYEYPGNVWGPPVPEMGKVYAVLSEENLDAKLMSLVMHASQWVSNENSLWGARGVKALAELRGTEISEQIAERFYVVRQVLN